MMAESVIVEIFEVQLYSSGAWGVDKKIPWTTNDGKTVSLPPDEAQLPGPEWSWASNWRIDKKPGSTDSEGWEYARYAERFLSTSRATKVSRGWRDVSRRRKWSRIMRRDARAGLAAQFQDAMPKIQNGLRSINGVRLRLESVARSAPEELHNKQIVNLIDSVRKNMHETMTLLVRLDSTTGENQKQATVIKKLKNDLAKEEAAIEAVVKLTDINESPKASSSSINAMQPQSRSKASPSISRGSKRQQEREHEKQMMIREQKISSEEGFFSDAQPQARKSKVVSGGRNQPLDLGKLTGGTQSQAEDGVFVQRTAQEQVILEKLIPIDEATVQAHIIEERSEAIEQIHKGLVEINEMFTDLSQLIKQQEGEVTSIVKNADESNARTEDAYNQILEANRLQRETCIIS